MESTSGSKLAINRDDVAFIEEKLPGLRGWLFPEAAQMTCHLYRMQSEIGEYGGALEIGVYEGRYLALLARLAAERNAATVGIDTFEFISQQDVRARMTAVLGSFPPGVTLVASRSTDIAPKQALAWFERPPSLISVDGDHSAAVVTKDLLFCDKVLSEKGLVIADDFLNHFAVGVTEGVYEFLRQPSINLTPCVFIGQKLMLCRPQHAAFYRQAAFQFGLQGTFRACEEFRVYLRRSRAYVEPSIAGQPVTMFVSSRCDASNLLGN